MPRDDRREETKQKTLTVHRKVLFVNSTGRQLWRTPCGQRSAFQCGSAAMHGSAVQARLSPTSGSLQRPEPGISQPTPPYKTAAQFFGLCLAPAFRVQGCVLCAAGAHADADDLSTPAVGSKKQEPPENRHWQCAKLRSPKMRVRTLQ